MKTELEKLLNESEAADLLGLRSQTLSLWRSTKRYDLPFIRVGRAIRYRLRDIAAFLERRTVGGATEKNNT